MTIDVTMSRHQEDEAEDARAFVVDHEDHEQGDDSLNSSIDEGTAATVRGSKGRQSLADKAAAFKSSKALEISSILPVLRSLPPIEHSTLPTAEELRTELAIASGGATHNPYSGKRRRFYCLTGAALLVVSVIVGLSVGLSSRNTNSSSLSSSTNGNINGGPSRLSAVQGFLSQRISLKSDLERAGSPQSLAAKWIADNDSFNAPIPASTDYQESYAFVQRYILAVFYFALGGKQWKYNMGFVTEQDECMWHIMLQANNPIPNTGVDNWKMGVQCNSLGEVEQIFIPSNGLYGQLPPEFGLLLALKRVSFFDNKLSGPLPSNMKLLVNLNFLAMESNKLSGPIPDWFDQFSKLEYLALGDNLLEGQLPSFASLQGLKEVALDSNRFNGSVAVFNENTQIEALFLQENAFSGRIDNSLFVKLGKLKTLDLSDNLMTGYFPQHFYRSTVVDLHNNTLTGGLPTVQLDVFPTEYLSLYNNQIKGSIPGTISKLSSLKHLDLSINKLTGDIPASLKSLTNLDYLYLANNLALNGGPIPDLSELTMLKELSLHHTNRNGTIPESIGSLTSLRLLNLHDNELEGAIPDVFRSLPRLQFLLLNRNKLSGSLPASFYYLRNLSLLLLDKNDLVGDDSSFCVAGGPSRLSFVVADCQPEFTCKCCTKCCEDSDMNCNNAVLAANLDDGYIRDQYVFSDNLKFEVNGKPSN